MDMDKENGGGFAITSFLSMSFSVSLYACLVMFLRGRYLLYHDGGLGVARWGEV